jgi:hypothetical protein
VNAACEVCKKSIESAKGKLTVKEAARAVSERDDRLLAERMEALEAANREVSVFVCDVWVLFLGFGGCLFGFVIDVAHGGTRGS